jgi:hypothetical protein
LKLSIIEYLVQYSTIMPESHTQPQHISTGLEKTGRDGTMNGHPQHSPSTTPSQEGSGNAQNEKQRLKNPWMDPDSFPDGGTKAWLTVAGASACLFVSFGWVNCIGVFQDYYQTHQLKDYTASDVSWIPALQSKLHGLPLHS